MSISDELDKLAELHRRGDLSDQEFDHAKARVLGDAGRNGAASTAINGLRRSRDDRWIGGVCGGIARTTGYAAWLWRLLFVLLVLCGGTGVLLYLLLWVLVPSDPAPAAGPHAQPHAG